MNFCKRLRVGIGNCILFVISVFLVKLVCVYLCNVIFVNVMININLLSFIYIKFFDLFIYMKGLFKFY